MLYQANLAFQLFVTKLWVRIPKNLSAWSYENRVSKHFVIFLNFPCLIACLLCCLLMLLFLLVLWLVICVEVHVDGIIILPPPLPPSLTIFLSLLTVLSLTQLTVI